MTNDIYAGRLFSFRKNLYLYASFRFPEYSPSTGFRRLRKIEQNCTPETGLHNTLFPRQPGLPGVKTTINRTHIYNFNKTTMTTQKSKTVQSRIIGTDEVITG